MLANPLKNNLSISGTKFYKMHTFSCGKSVPIYDVLSMYGLNQIIGHAKFNNKEYGEVLYRGENELHPGLIPSLFRECRDAQLWSIVSNLVDKIFDEKKIRVAMNAGTNKKRARNKIEGMLQHYGIKTRYIDLVDNHWVALWMGQYRCISNKRIEPYYHFEQRVVPLIEMANGKIDDEEILYQYILLIALPKPGNPPIDGIEDTTDFLKVDLRQALPSVFLRPHSQHGIVVRKKLQSGSTSADYDMATEVIGILRMRIDRVAHWLGNGILLSQDNLFPSPMNDYGYDLLLQLPNSFFPDGFSVVKYV